jgi:hypothetical protein
MFCFMLFFTILFFFYSLTFLQPVLPAAAFPGLLPHVPGRLLPRRAGLAVSVHDTKARVPASEQRGGDGHPGLA